MDDEINPIGARIRDVRARRSQQEFADALGCSLSTLRRYEAGERLPDAEFLLALREREAIDPTWVLTGEGGTTAALAMRYQGIAEHLESGELRTVRVKLGGTEHRVSIDDYRLVPVLNVRVAAGDGAVLGGENIMGWNAYRKDWLVARRLSDAVLSEVSVTGDSMSPELRKGDTVLVNHSDNRVQDGGIYVLRQGENLLVKYLQGLPGDRIQVSSEATQAYPPYVIEAADFESGECEIIGRVVRQGRDR